MHTVEFELRKQKEVQFMKRIYVGREFVSGLKKIARQSKDCEYLQLNVCQRVHKLVH